MKKCIGALGVLMISFIVSACSDKENSSALFTVGGVVSGSTGTLVLRNNGGSDLAVTVNGPFSFPTATASGSAYSVTVHANPAGQTCIVSNGTGTILVSNVANVAVDCSARGGLDVTFNSPNGFATVNDAAGGNGDDVGNAVAVDSQGRVVAAGSSLNSAGNMDMVVVRFNAGGTLDTTFNGTGIVVYDNTAGGSGDDSGKAVTVDSLDRILVTGSTTSAGNRDMVIWRYTSNGTLDTTFNGTGFVVYDNTAGGSGADFGNAIAIDSDHKILVTGSSTTTGGTTDMVIWRFNANGTVDTGFGGDGIVSAASGTGNASGNAIAIDNHKILVTGSTTNTAGTMDMVIWRFNANGTLDTTFNSPKGFAVHDNAAGGNGDDSGNAIAIGDQGKILVAGSSRNSNGDTDMVVWRYKTDGTLDTTFNNGSGFVVDNGAAGSNGDDSGKGIDIDSQGRIIVTGSSTRSPGNTDMVVWRFNADGSLDITFADYGIFVHNSAAGGNGDDSGNGIAVDSHDKILVGGSSMNSAGDADMAVWRVFP